MKTINKTDISYELNVSTHLAYDEGSKHVHNIRGKIFADDDEFNPQKIGTFKATHVQLSKVCNSDEDPYNVLDIEQSVFDVALEIINFKTYTAKQKIVNMFGKYSFHLGDFVIIESVELDSEWRGANIGASVIRDYIVNHIPMETFVVLEAGPFTKDCANESEKVVNDRVKKLEAHWKKIGFKKIKGSRFMILSSDSVLPEIEIGA